MADSLIDIPPLVGRDVRLTIEAGDLLDEMVEPTGAERRWPCVGGLGCSRQAARAEGERVAVGLQHRGRQRGGGSGNASSSTSVTPANLLSSIPLGESNPCLGRSGRLFKQREPGLREKKGPIRRWSSRTLRHASPRPLRGTWHLWRSSRRSSFGRVRPDESRLVPEVASLAAAGLHSDPGRTRRKGNLAAIALALGQ